MASRTYEVTCPDCGWTGKRRRKIRHGQPVVATDPLAKPCSCGGQVERSKS